MIRSDIGTPLYINKSFILDLAAGLIQGYLESTAVRFTAGIGGDIKLTSDIKNQKTSEDKLNVDTTDDADYKGGRSDLRGEYSNKKVFTTFYFFNNIRDILIERDLLRYITEKDIINKRVKCGDFVEFSANLCTTCIASPVSTIIDIFDSYDPKILDSLIKEKFDGYTNCTVIQKQLKCLSNCLNRNGTTDLVMNFNKAKAVLDINTNFFCDKNACAYDTADSECRTLCKVIRVIDEKSNIDLLRKTGMSSYYNSFLTSLSPYLQVLNDNGILVPDNFTTNISGPAIQAIPIAMYV